jgi:hypothetical protein
MHWIAWLAVGLAFEAYGALSNDITLSEGVWIAWQYDWAKPLILGAWALLSGHLFLGWWD